MEAMKYRTLALAAAFIMATMGIVIVVFFAAPKSPTGVQGQDPIDEIPVPLPLDSLEITRNHPSSLASHIPNGTHNVKRHHHSLTVDSLQTFSKMLPMLCNLKAIRINVIILDVNNWTDDVEFDSKQLQCVKRLTIKSSVIDLNVFSNRILSKATNLWDLNIHCPQTFIDEADRDLLLMVNLPKLNRLSIHGWTEACPKLLDWFGSDKIEGAPLNKLLFSDMPLFQAKSSGGCITTTGLIRKFSETLRVLNFNGVRADMPMFAAEVLPLENILNLRSSSIYFKNPESEAARQSAKLFLTQFGDHSSVAEFSTNAQFTFGDFQDSVIPLVNQLQTQKLAVEIGFEKNPSSVRFQFLSRLPDVKELELRLSVINRDRRGWPRESILLGDFKYLENTGSFHKFKVVSNVNFKAQGTLFHCRTLAINQMGTRYLLELNVDQQCNAI